MSVYLYICVWSLRSRSANSLASLRPQASPNTRWGTYIDICVGRFQYVTTSIDLHRYCSPVSHPQASPNTYWGTYIDICVGRFQCLLILMTTSIYLYRYCLPVSRPQASPNTYWGTYTDTCVGRFRYLSVKVTTSIYLHRYCSPVSRPQASPETTKGDGLYFCANTDSSSDSASHTHYARRPSAGWQKAGSFLPHSSFVFSKRKLQKLCVGRWGPVSLWMCVLSSALICNALAWRFSRRRENIQGARRVRSHAREPDLLRHTPHAADLQGGSSEWFQGHPEMYYLPQAEGVLLHAFDNRSRVCS